MSNTMQESKHNQPVWIDGTPYYPGQLISVTDNPIRPSRYFGTHKH